MSYFKRAEDITVSVALEFGSVTTDTLQQFQCKSGEIAGFRIQELDGLFISQIYDCSGEEPVLLGAAAVLPGIDLTGGYFSSGAFPDGDPLTVGTTFYKVDYV